MEEIIIDTHIKTINDLTLQQALTVSNSKIGTAEERAAVIAKIIVDGSIAANKLRFIRGC